MTTDKPVNIYRAVHIATGKTHYFVGEFDANTGSYVLPEKPSFRKVIGGTGRRRRFDTFADAVGEHGHGYSDREVAVQSVYSKKSGGYSRMVEEGWDINLGEGYKPWYGRRRGRQRVG